MKLVSYVPRNRWAWALLLASLGLTWGAWQLYAGRWHSSPTRSRAFMQTARVQPLHFVEGYFPVNRPVPLYVSQFGNEWDHPRGVSAPAWYELHNYSRGTSILQRNWSGFRFQEAPNGAIQVEGVPVPKSENRTMLVSIPIRFQAAGEKSLTWHGVGTELTLEAFAVTASGPAFTIDRNRINKGAPENLFTNQGAVPTIPVITFHHAAHPEMEADESVFPAGIFVPGQQELALNRLTLLFRIVGDPDLFRARGIAATVYDARTHAILGAGLIPRFCATDDGNFLMIDAYVSLWHDTPLDVVLDLPEGPVQRQDVDLAEEGAVYQFAGEYAPRVTMLMALDGYQALRPDKTGTSMTLRRVIATREPCVSVFWDLGELKNADFLDLEYQRADGGWGGQRLRNDFKGWNPAPGTNWRLSYYPGYQHVCFRIPGMPMMPNSRSGTRDLLDMRIPWSKEFPVSYTSIATMAQLSLILEGGASDGISMRDKPMLTIREWLKQNSNLHRHRITVDSRKMQLRVGPRKPSWTDHIQEWWKKNVKAP